MNASILVIKSQENRIAVRKPFMEYSGSVTVGIPSSEIYVQYQEKKKWCGRKPIILTELEIEYMHAKLQEGWTPDVIVGRVENLLSCGVSSLHRRFRQGLFNIT